MRLRGGTAAAARVFGRSVRFFAVAFQVFAGASDGKTLFVEQALDFENRLDILAAVEAMPAGTLHRLEHGEFCFPIAQDKRLRRRQAADFADAE